MRRAPVFANLPGGSVVSSGCSKRQVDTILPLALLRPAESLRWRRVRVPTCGVVALPLGPRVMTLGPAEQTTVAFGLAGLASGPRRSCAQAGRWSSSPLVFDLFLYFLNIFKSLQIQNFVSDSFELRKL
jgi:hypothetical protein